MIGCGPAYQADCAVSDVLTQFVNEEGRLNEMVSRQIDNSDPILRLGSRTRRQFPTGMGDVVTDVILTTTIPTSEVGRNWNRVQHATCDSSPCCTDPELIRYGSEKFTGCLSQRAFKTPEFCVIDLTFKHRREQQMRNFLDSLPVWTMHVQKFWYRQSFRDCTPSMVLNQNAGNPITFGDYADFAKPSSALTPSHLDEIYLKLMDAGANLSPFTTSGGIPIQVALIGHEEFRFLDILDKQENNAIGAQGESIRVEAFGRVRQIRNFVFVLVQYPTRLGDDQGGTYVEIDSHVEFKTQNGHESRANPDYRNPNVARYTETVFWNVEAAHWLTAPNFEGIGQLQFGAQDFSGRFRLINFPTPCDPTAKNAYFLAEYMNGMIPRHPTRSITVLSLAVHIRGCDRDPIVCGAPDVVAESTAHIKSICIIPNVPGQLSITHDINSPLPTVGAGQALFLRTRKGDLARVQSVDYSGGSDPCCIQTVITLEDADLAEVRTCDPWWELVATSDQSPTDVSAENDCDICDDAVTADVAAPTVVVSGDLNHDAGAPYTLIVSFSEPIQEAAAAIEAALVVNNGTVDAASFVADATNEVFTGTVTPTAGTSIVDATFPASAATDIAGNANTVSNTYVTPPAAG